MTQKCRLEDKVIKFEIWDTAGQERFHSLAPMYYRNAQAAVVAYDVTKGVRPRPLHADTGRSADRARQPSLDKAKSWVKELQRQANPNIVIALIGNKLDLVQPDAAAGDAPAASGSDDDDDSEADDATATPADGASSKPAAAAGSASKRQVSREEAEAYAQEAGLLFFETSAKTGDGVVEVFTEIGPSIFQLAAGSVPDGRRSQEDPSRTHSLVDRRSTECPSGRSQRTGRRQRVRRTGWPGQARRGRRPGRRPARQGRVRVLRRILALYNVVVRVFPRPQLCRQQSWW